MFTYQNMPSGNPDGLIPVSPRPSPNCPWCWKVEHPNEAFPVGRNSRICMFHEAWLMQELEAFYRSQPPPSNKQDE